MDKKEFWNSMRALASDLAWTIGILALIGLVMLMGAIGCWRDRGPIRNQWETQALEIAGKVYGVDFLVKTPPQLTVGYPEAVCVDGFPRLTGLGKPGYITAKGNCSYGAVAPYMPHINVAWLPGMTYAQSGFCQACYQMWEVQTFGLPDVYATTPRWTSGEAHKKIAECQEALRKAGL